MRQGLAGEHLELPAGVAAGQVADGLAAAVEHQDRVGRVRGGEAGRGGVGDVVRHEADPLLGEPGQVVGEEGRRLLARTSCA